MKCPVDGVFCFATVCQHAECRWGPLETAPATQSTEGEIEDLAEAMEFVAAYNPRTPIEGFLAGVRWARGL